MNNKITNFIQIKKKFVALKRAVGLDLGLLKIAEAIYLLEVYLVTALVPSETACLANSPGRMRRTAVWNQMLVNLINKIC